MTTTPASSAARARYAREAVTTASPATLLLMLYDRLVRDLITAEQSLADGDLARASTELVHAQEVVGELHSSLDVTAWDGAAGLAALYLFVRSELVTANLRKDGAQVTAVRELVEPLRDAWRQAALQSVSQPA